MKAERHLRPDTNEPNDYQLFAPLSDEELALLERDILERGILVPIEFDTEGNVLDGHHRLRIAEKHGLDFPRVERRLETEAEKLGHVLALNMARRQLKPHQWGAAFRQLLAIRGVQTTRGPKASGAKEPSGNKRYSSHIYHQCGQSVAGPIV